MGPVHAVPRGRWGTDGGDFTRPPELGAEHDRKAYVGPSPKLVATSWGVLLRHRQVRAHARIAACTACRGGAARHAVALSSASPAEALEPCVAAWRLEHLANTGDEGFVGREDGDCTALAARENRLHANRRRILARGGLRYRAPRPDRLHATNFGDSTNQPLHNNGRRQPRLRTGAKSMHLLPPSVRLRGLVPAPLRSVFVANALPSALALVFGWLPVPGAGGPVTRSTWTLGRTCVLRDGELCGDD